MRGEEEKENELILDMHQQEKDAIQSHFNRTKHGMNTMRQDQAKLLQRLSLQVRGINAPLCPCLIASEQECCSTGACLTMLKTGGPPIENC